ncbi:UbiA family prenyltransferase [Salinicola sp. CPA57]|uniref:UbiA family prenyltransferase n=1 Tax=Salinicola sp. CPA57 TaxID=1949080 RepID=UPI0018E4FFC9|nr:UbiA family prenyltransferase [Salinicola sp. CPA57]
MGQAAVDLTAIEPEEVEQRAARSRIPGLTSKVWLELGRVSNLPTVWSNALAGVVLAGAGTGALWSATAAWPLLLALTLFYLGGMYLNDACDAEIDARERANRPIPRGDIDRLTVTLLGVGMLGLGSLLLFLSHLSAGITGLALVAAILGYDWWHKRIGWSPLLMGACRLLTYLTAALVVAGVLNEAVLWGAIGLACHVVGLTYAARQEAYDRLGATWPLAVMAVPVVFMLAAMLTGPEPSLLALVLWLGYLIWGTRCLMWLFRRAPGDVPRAVVGLIAAISLYDATLMAAMGATTMAMLGVLAFAATLALQRVTSGT